MTEDEERRFDDRFPDVGGNYVVFIVGAQYGPSKRWPDSHFSALADLLVERFPVRVYLLPGKGEEGVARRVYEGAKHKERVEIKDMDMRELKVALSRASLVVSNDTGPRHISVALSVPTIVILGPMDERYTAYPEPPYLCDEQGHTLQAVQHAPLRQGPRMPERHRPGGSPGKGGGGFR